MIFLSSTADGHIRRTLSPPFGGNHPTGLDVPRSVSGSSSVNNVSVVSLFILSVDNCAWIEVSSKTAGEKASDALRTLWQVRWFPERYIWKEKSFFFLTVYYQTTLVAHVVRSQLSPSCSLVHYALTFFLLQGEKTAMHSHTSLQFSLFRSRVTPFRQTDPHANTIPNSIPKLLPFKASTPLNTQL